MTLIDDAFLIFWNENKVVRQMSKKSRFRRPFNKQHGKRWQTLFKSDQQHLYYIYWPVWSKFSWKESLLVICKILGLFVKTLTAYDNYCLLNRNNLAQPIQIYLSKKQKKIQPIQIYLSKKQKKIQPIQIYLSKKQKKIS